VSPRFSTSAFAYSGSLNGSAFVSVISTFATPARRSPAPGARFGGLSLGASAGGAISGARLPAPGEGEREAEH